MSPLISRKRSDTPVPISGFTDVVFACAEAQDFGKEDLKISNLECAPKDGWPASLKPGEVNVVVCS